LRPNDTNFVPPRNGRETQGCDLLLAINNGVGAMTLILSLIYREYCRSCLQHCRYF
jgi:hypothetical protein